MNDTTTALFQTPTTWLLLGVALVSALIIIQTLCQGRRRHSLPEWPVVGMLPSLFLALRGNLYEWMSEGLRLCNGTFLFKGGMTGLTILVITDPRNVEYLLKTRFESFPKGEKFRSRIRDLFGDGIFNVDGEMWRRQRWTASVVFHSAEFRRLAAESTTELVHSRLLPVLQDTVDKDTSIDLQDVMLRLAFDNICIIGFGLDPGSLQVGLPETAFAQAFDDTIETISSRLLMPMWMWRAMRWLNVGAERRLKNSIKGINDFANEVIWTRKQELLSLDNDAKSRGDLLMAFMRVRDDEGNEFDDKFLRDVCVNFIFAGRDTSSAALSWFFWVLDGYPAVEERILGEILGVLGGRADGDEVVFTVEEVKKMEYLHAAISESLRLYPSTALDTREVASDEVFPDGTAIKKGTKVGYALYAMGRMESVWGEDCEEFKPERWLRDGRFTSEPAHKFAVFNAGPRICLGKDFAYHQMKHVAASIIHKYRVRLVKGHPVKPKIALTMCIKRGLQVNLIKRDPYELKK